VIEEANAWIEPDLSVVEHPLRILDVKERKTRRQSVKMYKHPLRILDVKERKTRRQSAKMYKI
jgi:hypothetical protein